MPGACSGTVGRGCATSTATSTSRCAPMTGAGFTCWACPTGGCASRARPRRTARCACGSMTAGRSGARCRRRRRAARARRRARAPFRAGGPGRAVGRARGGGGQADGAAAGDRDRGPCRSGAVGVARPAADRAGSDEDGACHRRAARTARSRRCISVAGDQVEEGAELISFADARAARGRDERRRHDGASAQAFGRQRPTSRILRRFSASALRQSARNGGTPRLWHRTRHMPRRSEELLAGGSIYWVIGGRIRARQRLVGFESDRDPDGRKICRFMLDTDLVPTEPWPHRAFQGWRYLDPKDAPAGPAGGRGRRGDAGGDDRGAARPGTALGPGPGRTGNCTLVVRRWAKNAQSMRSPHCGMKVRKLYSGIATALEPI